MYSVRLHSWRLVPALAAVLAVGCGDGNTLSSPTAPSALPDAASLTAADVPDSPGMASDAEAFDSRGSGSGGGSGSSGSGGSGSGNSGSGSGNSGSGNSGSGNSGSGNSGSGNSGSGSGRDDDKERGRGGDKGNRGPGSAGDDDNRGPGRVNPDSVSGFVTNVDRDKNEITIRGVTVKIIAGQTIIRHGNRQFEIDDIHPGDHAQVRFTVSADGTRIATEVKVEDIGRDNDDEEVEEARREVRIKLEAVVTDRSGSCPDISFKLGGISVQTTANTDFEIPCEQVVNDVPVEVDRRAAITNGVLIAREVEASDDGLGEPEFEAEGPIESLAQSNGGCTVTVLGLSFVAGTFTRFDEIQGCGGLTVGNMLIRARGALSNPPATPVLPPRAREVKRRR